MSSKNIKIQSLYDFIQQSFFGSNYLLTIEVGTLHQQLQQKYDRMEHFLQALSQCLIILLKQEPKDQEVVKINIIQKLIQDIIQQDQVLI
ncbi:hypothetical protein ABPG72_007355 [Tetrahymena utriculariae]